MAYNVQGLWQNRVVYIQLTGNITLADLEAINDEINHHIAAGETPIHIIIDQLQVEQFPTNVKAVRQAMTLAPRDGSLGWIVNLSDNRMANFISVKARELEPGQ